MPHARTTELQFQVPPERRRMTGSATNFADKSQRQIPSRFVEPTVGCHKFLFAGLDLGGWNRDINVEKIHEAHVENGCDLGERGEAEGSVPAFKSRKADRTDAYGFGKTLLRPASLASNISEALAYGT